MAEGTARTPWLSIEGVLLIALGIASLVMPMMAGLAAILVFAWILIVSGMIGLISAFAGREHSHLGWSLASAVIALGIGLTLFISPMAGAVGLTLVVGTYLLIDGVVLVGLALDHRRRGDAKWSWMMGSGLIDLTLAGLLALLSVTGAPVLVGVFVGVSLIAAGSALLMLHRGPAGA